MNEQITLIVGLIIFAVLYFVSKRYEVTSKTELPILLLICCGAMICNIWLNVYIGKV